MIEKKRSPWKIIRTIILLFVVSLMLQIAFFNFTHEYHLVVGKSMYPTLNVNEDDEDAVFVSKIKKCSRGDLIVVKKEDPEEVKHVIKRLIALDGDKVCIKEHEGNIRIFIIYQGETEPKLLEEGYLLNYSVNVGLNVRFYNMAEHFNLEINAKGFVTIPDGYIFYLGDNRQNSNDCSYEFYGPVKRECMKGRVDYIVKANENAYWQLLKHLFGW